MQTVLFLFLASVALSSPALRAESTLSPDALLLARWIADQQYSNPNLPGFGALKVFPAPAFVTTNGAKYCRTSPYYSDLAVLGLLRTRAPGCAQLADRWIRWYFTHLTPPSAPDGVPYEHFYYPDGAGETTCAKPGDQFLCHYNDATDSAAATFFSVLWARSMEGSPLAADFSSHKPAIEKLAGVLLNLQQPDGLCWAKTDYRVKYTEDNSEVFAGLRDLASLEREIFHDSEKAVLYQETAEKVRSGILSELYDPREHLFRIAKFETLSHTAVNLNQWYPDTQAQFWPTLWGVLSPTDPRARAIVSAMDAHWNGTIKPDWSAHPEKINDGWIEAGSALSALLAGDTARVRNYVQAVERVKFVRTSGALKLKYPFDIGDASWFLQILAKVRD